METNQNKKNEPLTKDIIVWDARLEEFFIEELINIFDAEKQITQALPKMQKAAGFPKLQQAFEEHLDVTEVQITRLMQIFEILGEEAVLKTCGAMEEIIKEGEHVISNSEEGSATRDLGLITAAQKVEHYEIATYGTLVQLANSLGYIEVAQLLEATLDEEQEEDQLLTDIASDNISYQTNDEIRNNSL